MSDEKLRLGGRQFLIGMVLLVVIAAAGLTILFLNPTTPTPATVPPTTENPGASLDPTVVQQLTAIPDMQLVTGELGEELANLQTLVDDCDKYNTARRQQMRLHFLWLQNPSEIPFDVALAIANNPPGRLLFGMATFTSAQWNQNDANPDSCLVEIGLRLNDLLPTYDEPVLEDYQSG